MNNVITTCKKKTSRRTCQLVALAMLGALLGPALAHASNKDNRNDQRHDNRGEQKHDNRADMEHDNRGNSEHGNRNQKDDRGRDQHSDKRFNDHHRQFAHDYYDNQKRQGRYREVHTRRYEIGRQLPRDVIFYEVPRSFAREFGQPPRGYRYVRVSNDILLIRAITGLVVDALQH